MPPCGGHFCGEGRAVPRKPSSAPGGYQPAGSAGAVWGEEERDALLARFLAEDRAVPFTLAQAPLMRLAVIRIAADSHILVFSHHHLILDGWSTAVMMEEVLALYAGNVQETAAALPAAPR